MTELSTLDQFAEALSEHGDIRRAAKDLYLEYAEGKVLFDAICIGLGPQAFDRRIHPAVSEIQSVVAHGFGIDVSEMYSQRRSRAVARPRQAAMYLAKRKTPYSLPMIGRLFGGRDHTTVIHAVNRVESLRGSDPAFNAKIAELEASL